MEGYHTDSVEVVFTSGQLKDTILSVLDEIEKANVFGSDSQEWVDDKISEIRKRWEE